MLRCRKCAYALDERDEPPERCPNCGTPTRAPEPEPELSVALGTAWRRGADRAVPGDSKADARAAPVAAEASGPPPTSAVGPPAGRATVGESAPASDASPGPTRAAARATPAITSLPVGVVPGVAPRSPRRGTGFYPAVPDTPAPAPAVFAPPSARPAGTASRAAIVLQPLAPPGLRDSPAGRETSEAAAGPRGAERPATAPGPADSFSAPATGDRAASAASSGAGLAIGRLAVERTATPGPRDRSAVSGAAGLGDRSGDAPARADEDPSAQVPLATLLAALEDSLAGVAAERLPSAALTEHDEADPPPAPAEAAVAPALPGTSRRGRAAELDATSDQHVRPDLAARADAAPERSNRRADTARMSAARSRPAGLRLADSDDDLPAPVASSRPFTVPKAARRVPVPAATAAINELENSAELDLPHLASRTNQGSIETVVAAPRAPGGSRPDDVDLDLDDLHGETPSDPPVAAPSVSASSGAAAGPARASLRPTPRPRPLHRLPPSSAQPDPPALAYVGLVALALGLAGLWTFYFTRAPGLTAAATASSSVSRGMSSGTWPEGYLAAQAARLDADRVEDYLAALVEAEAIGDKLGRAEAALCMHLRYGPDLVRRSAAAVWQKQAAPGDPRAGRVDGLAALAEGDLEATHRLLAGVDDPRARLYRALAAEQQGDAATARREAELALAQRPGDAAAALVVATATLAAQRDAPLAALQAAAEQHPDHPLYRQALVRALLERGRLADARALSAALGRVAGASEAHQAQVLALQAEVAAATGEVGTALAWVEEAGKLAPNNLGTKLARVRLLLQVGDLGRAQQELGPLLRAMPDDPAPLALQAELAILAGNESAATRAIDRLATVDRGRGRIAVLRGRVHAMRGRSEDAAAAFTAALTEDPADFAAAIALAELRARAGTSEPLAPLLRAETLLRADPRAANRAGLRALTLAHANLLVEAGRKDQAIAVLDAALALDPDDNAAQLRRGVLAIEQGRVTSGRADLMAVRERTDGYPGLVGPLGRLYLREGDLAGLVGLVQPHASDPRAPDDIVLMNGLWRLAQGDLDAADANIDRVLQRNPNSWEAHLAKARVHYERERIPDALAEVRLARPRHPDAEVELWTGKIVERSGKPQEAITAYRRARQLDPGLTEAAYLLGRALLAQGLAREAVVELQSVTRAAEVPAGAHLALGLAFREREQLPDALESFEHAINHDPNPEEALYWAGRTEVELGRPAEALPRLGRAVALATPGALWQADAHLWLGRAHHRLGHRAEARGAFSAYLIHAGPKAPARAEVEKLLRER